MRLKLACTEGPRLSRILEIKVLMTQGTNILIDVIVAVLISISLQANDYNKYQLKCAIDHLLARLNNSH